jgi:hypothetical protein
MIMDKKILDQKFKYLFMTEMDHKDFALKSVDLSEDGTSGYVLYLTFDYFMDVDPEPSVISYYLEKGLESCTQFATKYQYDDVTGEISDTQKYTVGPSLVFGLDYEWGTSFIMTVAIHVNY